MKNSIYCIIKILEHIENSYFGKEKHTQWGKRFAQGHQVSLYTKLRFSASSTRLYP